MAAVKTTISLEQPLFVQVEKLARTMKVSRSRFCALALQEYIRRQQNRQLLVRINEAYQGPPEKAEQDRLRKMRRGHRKMVDEPR